MAVSAQNKIGRPSMFGDKKAAVASLLKQYTQMRKKKSMSVLLSGDLVPLVKARFDLKGRTDAAIRQAVYRIVREHKLYLSRSVS